MRNWNREYLDFAKDKGWRQKNDVVQLALYSDTLQTFRLAAQGKTPGRQPPEHLRERIATYFDPLPFWYPPLEDAATDRAALSAHRDHAAADGDVPRVGFAERVAAPDPQPQLPARQSAHRARGRHRRRRLVLGREPLGARALHASLQRGGRAGNGVDLERDRQGRRRLAARARRRRGEEGLPPQPPDQRRAADGDRPDQQLRSDHRPGRLVRRARADPPGRRPTSPPRPRRASPRPPNDRRAEGAVRARAKRARRRRAGRRARAPARARHRPQRLRRLPRLRDLVQGMEHRRARPARSSTRTPTARTRPGRSSTASRPTRPASSRTPRRSTSRRAACTARTRRAFRSARPARATSGRATASSWSTTTSASAASTARGRARTARARSTRRAR